MTPIDPRGACLFIEGLEKYLPENIDQMWMVGCLVNLSQAFSELSPILTDEQVEAISSAGALIIRQITAETIAGIATDDLLGRIQDDRRGR